MNIWVVKEYHDDHLVEYYLYLHKEKAYEKVYELEEKYKLHHTPNYYIRHANEDESIVVALLQEEIIE